MKKVLLIVATLSAIASPAFADGWDHISPDQTKIRQQFFREYLAAHKLACKFPDIGESSKQLASHVWADALTGISMFCEKRQGRFTSARS